MNTRTLLTLLSSSLLFATTLPLSTFAADELSGIWQGTLGKSSVRVCFNQYGSGSYYYQRYLTPIQLELQNGIWKEENNTGNWQFDSATAQQLSGHWFKDNSGKSLPIKLERQLSPDNQDDCSADAYNLPLETKPSLSRGKWQSFQTIEYRPLTYGTEVGIEFNGPQKAFPPLISGLRKNSPMMRSWHKPLIRAAECCLKWAILWPMRPMQNRFSSISIGSACAYTAGRRVLAPMDQPRVC